MDHSNDKELFLIDSATTHTILRNKIYFSQMTLVEAKVNTISGAAKLIEGSRKAYVMLPNGTKIIINGALYSSKSRRNLLSFKDMRQNGYHIETMNENQKEYICLTTTKSGTKYICEKCQHIPQDYISHILVHLK
ncbi:unnamed protein product [Cuscuta europaea]|uniref:Retrovirus-related Pol polyprotein from transposon TNT 1-94-like beta-barrel domain-containing protein n=1 Tax=Cuscuta europaea TaxID=41803 RepID=A0A9P0Z127_CUSEU|nr:unnamed protein product [Cuscuta europaea]